MEIKQEHIELFKKIHEPYGGLPYSEDELRDLLQGLYNIFSYGYRIQQRINKEHNNADGDQKP